MHVNRCTAQWMQWFAVYRSVSGCLKVADDAFDALVPIAVVREPLVIDGGQVDCWYAEARLSSPTSVRVALVRVKMSVLTAVCDKDDRGWARTGNAKGPRVVRWERLDDPSDLEFVSAELASGSIIQLSRCPDETPWLRRRRQSTSDTRTRTAVELAAAMAIHFSADDSSDRGEEDSALSCRGRLERAKS
jgi:hypothetical protein